MLSRKWLQTYFRKVARTSLLGGCVTALGIPVSALAFQDLPEFQQAGEEAKSDGLIRDDLGRIAFIVELRGDSAKGFSSNFASDKRFQTYQKGEAVNLVRSMESQYRLEATSMTSWSSTSFTAFLDDRQFDRLSRDARVVQILPDVAMTFSADSTAVWSDSAATLAAPPNALWNTLVSQSSEMQAWGKRAINQSTTSSSGSAIVYVVDAGVGQHVDLNVVQWVNAVDHTNDCGTRAGVAPPLAACTAAKLKKLVGCYTHATAVAGIVGAKSNGTGVVGIDPGAKIVSVSILDPAAYPNTPSSSCVNLPTASGATIQASRVKTALDWVASDIAANIHTGRPSVVNLSLNWVTPSQWPASGIAAVKADMAALGSSTPGAFVVQSAGNQYANACTYSYGPASASDGVMVVGAINNHGQPVVPLHGAPGFWRELVGFGHEMGSNYGACVEAWAPGDAVFTTAAPVTSQQGDVVYSTYAYGAGTSFAAPHVAGLAAYLIETRALTSPSQVEQNVRGTLFDLGSLDPGGAAIKIPTLNPIVGSAPRNTPYAEFVLANRCIWPNFATGTPPAGCRVLSATQDPSFITGVARNFGSLSMAGQTNVWASFDSYGTGAYSCKVQILDALGTPRTLYTGKQYYDPASLFRANTYAASADCPSASGVVGN